MISISNGPQGLYIAAEGSEQCLFQRSNVLFVFPEKSSLRIVRNSEYLTNDLAALLQQVAYDAKDDIFICSERKVYCAGNQKIHDISTQYDAKNLVVRLTPMPAKDFVDFLEHSNAGQFGFVTQDAALIFSPNIALSDAPLVYQRKQQALFADIIFSWFRAVTSVYTRELPIFVHNLCACYAKIPAMLLDVKAGKTDASLATHALWSTLLQGTEYFAFYKVVEQKDKQLRDENKELIDMLNWALDGCMEKIK